MVGVQHPRLAQHPRHRQPLAAELALPGRVRRRLRGHLARVLGKGLSAFMRLEKGRLEALRRGALGRRRTTPR